MAWFILIIAGLFEIVWAVGLKYSDGFSKTVPSVFTVISMIISMVLLGFSVKWLPVGTAYAVWTGIGTIGTVILGILLFNEPKDLIRLFFIFCILTGIVGLKLTSNAQ